MRTNRVLIAGAGPTGAVLAYALPRRDIPVVLIEALAPPPPDRRYLVGCVVLAGDAAHVNNPAGGMGKNGGIHDAIKLADKKYVVERARKLEGIGRQSIAPVQHDAFIRSACLTAGCTVQELFDGRDAHLTRS